MSSSSSSASVALPSILLSSFPTLDAPVVDYLTAILIDLLPTLHSASTLSSLFSSLLLNQELVDSPPLADQACISLYSQLTRANLVKPRATRATAPSPSSSAAAKPAPLPIESKETEPDPADASSELPYDPFVTIAVASTSRKPRRTVHPAAPSTTLPRPSLPSTSSPSSAPSPPSDASSSPSSSSSSSSASPDIDIGYACDALYPSDSLYYPAIVTALEVGGDKLQVLYLDYGNYQWLTREEVRNVRDEAADEGEGGDEDDGEGGAVGGVGGVRGAGVKVLTKAIRIGDAEEQEREKREKRRAERKKEEERRELERGGTGLKLSRKKLLERERKRVEDEAKRQWDESKRKEEIAAALPIHLKAVELMRRDRSRKWERDVQITELTLLAPDNAVLLHNTEFRLVAGRRYGLIGRNGIGKTTLLRQLSAYKIGGFPAYLKVQHVEQEISGDDCTVIESVLNADIERRLLMEEEKRLTAERKEKAASSSSSSPPAAADDAEDRLSDVYQRLQDIDAWSAEARASTICAGLGFTPAMQQMKTRDLSGGWRMRVSLASALLVNPDILLLDEPTNHLDFPAVLWLTQYLSHTFTKTLICVSHDRTFLNEVITDVIYFSNRQSLEYHRGDYSHFVKVKQANYVADKRAYDAQQMKIQHIEEFITTFRTEKKGAAQDRKVGQVLSRLKVLEKLERLPNPDDEKVVVFSLDFPEPSPLRQPLVANVKHLFFAYDATRTGQQRSADDAWLLQDVSVTVEMHSRIGILGANGVGKSTLIKLITGDLQPKDGIVWLNPSVSVALFTQHHVDQLDLGLTPVELLRTMFPGTEIESCRRHLGRFGLGADWSLIQIGHLSGGQKSRLAFAIMTWKQPHLIIMDEPTNHLDMETIDVLIDALNRFKGAVITVSHDQFYLTRTVKQYWAVGKGVVKTFDNLEDCKRFSYK